MGTNGAFGGSDAAAWEQARDQWTALGGSSWSAAEEASPSDSQPQERGDPAFDPLITAIAEALIGEDPDARRPAVPTFPLSATLPRRGNSSGAGSAGGGGGGGGTGLAGEVRQAEPAELRLRPLAAETQSGQPPHTATAMPPLWRGTA